MRRATLLIALLGLVNGAPCADGLETIYANVLFPVAVGKGSGDVAVPVEEGAVFGEYEPFPIHAYFSDGSERSLKIVSVTTWTGHGPDGVATDTYVNYNVAVEQANRIRFFSPQRYEFGSHAFFRRVEVTNNTVAGSVRGYLAKTSRTFAAVRDSDGCRTQVDRGRLTEYRNAVAHFYVFDLQCRDPSAQRKKGDAYVGLIAAGGDGAHALVWEHRSKHGECPAYGIVGEAADLDLDGHIELQVEERCGADSNVYVAEFGSGGFERLVSLEKSVRGTPEYPVERYTGLLKAARSP